MTCSALRFLIVLTLALLSAQARAAENLSPRVNEFLSRADSAGAATFLRQKLNETPDDPQAQFALGVVEVVQAVEQLGQRQYQMGALSGRLQLPIFRLPVAKNPDPGEVTYAQVREMMADLQASLLKAEEGLQKVALKDDLALNLDLATVQLNLTGDPKQPVRLRNLVLQLTRRGAPNDASDADQQTAMPVRLDAGDVLWLRGYCHFLAGCCDLFLAYDHQRLFDHCGHLVYARPVASEAPSEPLTLSDDPHLRETILDAIAAIHLIDFAPKEPQRMAAARQHWLEVIRLSRDSWKQLLAETDNQNEWLPNPKQTGVLQIPVNREQIDGWHAVLAEMEALLEGRKLVPYWRDNLSIADRPAEWPETGRGINLRKFFDEPRRFDLVLFIQGSGVLPYVEHGQLSHPTTWNRLSSAFRGQFFGFAVWFN